MKTRSRPARSVSVRRKGAVATVTLNRGEAQNRLTLETMTLLRDTALKLAREPELAAVIVQGRGVFSAGVDVSALGGEDRSLLERREAQKLGPALCKAWEDIEAFTIAAIEGYCVGGAAALAAALDYRILGRSAFLRLPEVPLGINMSWQTLPRLVAQIGPARAKQYVILGRRIAAEQALAWGLCEEICADGETLSAAQKLAAEICSLPPVPVRMTKHSINAIAGALAPLASHMDRDQFLLTAATDDFTEAVRAFKQKRRPRFRGR